MRKRTISVDGQVSRADFGRWMIYNRGTSEKFLYARNGTVDVMPAPFRWRKLLKSLKPSPSQYLHEDWKRALSTPIERRLAELWIASERLWRAGLGPRPQGIVTVRQLFRDGKALGPTAGFVTEDVNRLPTREPPSVEDLVAAGVQPDLILSCVRQPLNGYVIDLCSVKGVQPIDAEQEVQQLCEHIGLLMRKN